MRKPKQPDQKKRQPQQRTPNDLSRCLCPLNTEHTLIAVVELSLSGWLVAGVVPEVERQPLKKLKPEPGNLLELLRRGTEPCCASSAMETSKDAGLSRNSQSAALDRWDTEGGAVAPPVSTHPPLQATLTEQEASILNRLGAALLSRWNDLPTGIRQQLFESYFDTVAPQEAAGVKRRVARFIHNYKDDLRGAR